MKTLLRKFEKMMAAAAFAEEGLFDAARQIMNEDRIRKSDRPSDHLRPTARKQMRAD